jgi:hypothetical protein
MATKTANMEEEGAPVGDPGKATYAPNPKAELGPEDFVTPERKSAHAGPQFVSPPTDASTPSSTEGPCRFRILEEVIEEAPVVVPSPSCLLGMEELTTFDEANEEQAWGEAMQAELSSIESNRTWELADFPKGHKAIGLKWVHELNKDPEGRVVKHKVRLVAKGYVQRQGIEFSSTAT